MLEIDRLRLQAGPQILLDGVSTQFQPGLVYAIIGPNGTGKSTLLRTLFGDNKAISGTVRYAGQEQLATRSSDWRQLFGYMPQDSHISADLSVLEVVLLGQMSRLGVRVADEQLHKALLALESVGLLHLAHRPIHALSGGQRQLSLFAQVLLRDPRIMLLDEPVSALDLKHQLLLLDQARTLTRERQWITIMVLHDLNLTAQFADTIIALNQGQMLACGSPQQVLTPHLVEQLYGVPVRVQLDEDGTPFIRPSRTQTPPCADKAQPATLPQAA
ncbi:ABC transporter ATP-binding protein [Curvibacter sp. CHRR-16]|uniref:ABC transporter ATP-binding protein n=1 Tax=Curvibacter sp. CHRR-16 TaxID=2835872 RepID=UPI001BD915BB|nr:ABC transporter ATP-binding protein [Curvibacter sp. CHRR-16]MBT0569063.1 ABC transporter ATP-binding protein [Curvibacter sp. CHRR-16]